MARVSALQFCGLTAAVALALPAAAAPGRGSGTRTSTGKAAPAAAKSGGKLPVKTAWQSPPGTAVALINGKPITVAQWVERMSLMSGTRALDSLVNDEIIRQEAQKQGIRVAPAELNQKVEEDLKTIRQRAGSEERFQEMLKQQKMTPAGLRDVLRSTTEIRLLQEKLREKVTASVKATDQELAEAYEAQKFQYQIPDEARVSHILVAVAGTDMETDAKAKQKAEGFQARAKGLTAEKFADLARELSEDMDTKAKGGELPVLRKPSFFGPAFDEAVFGAEPGLLKEPVRSFRGYHVVYLHEKKPARTRPMEEVKPQLQDQVLGRKKNERFMAYMDDVQKNAKQEIRLQY